MPKGGAKLRAIGLAVVATVLVVTLGLGAVTWISRTSGPAVRIVSDEGGVAVSVPRQWTVDKKHPTDPEHAEYLNGHESAAFGFLQRGGFWVARWSVSADKTLNELKAEKTRQQAYRKREEWSVRDGRVGGRPAIFERFVKTPHGFNRLRLGETKLVVREVIADGSVIQMGTWTTPHAGDVARQLDALAQSLEILRPQPWQAELPDKGARFTLPAGWSERPTELKGASFFALAPGDPAEAWAYVFHYADSPAASLRTARKSITGNKGVLAGQHDTTLGGHRAVRLDFTFPDGKYGDARDAEWFVSDGKGGTYVLAVGRRLGDERIHDRIAKTWRFG
jgi:hypothetical protein